MKRRALILDRDGVINEDRGYVHRPDQICFIDGIFDLARKACSADWPVIVVTNQAGIGRGLYSEHDFHDLCAWMSTEFVRRGAAISQVYHCPYHAEHGIGPYKRASYDRKPNPGMILAAQEQFCLDLESSIMVGDRHSDMVAALTAGVGTRILFRPQKGESRSACTAITDHLSDIIPLIHAGQLIASPQEARRA